MHACQLLPPSVRLGVSALALQLHDWRLIFRVREVVHAALG